MIDSVLRGTGNSRFLKSAVPAGTSWADALAMLQAGTFPIDFNGINTEGFQQVGTPLNKANLLKDATAAQIGLPPSTTPDGMFEALGNTGELHVWRKTITSGTGTYSLGAVQEGLHYIKWANNSATSDSSGTFEYGSEIAVNNDGTITGIKNPSTITIKPWDDDASKANVFKGKFIKMISQVETSMSHFKIGEIWWIPADAVMTKGLLNGESGRWYIAASKRQQVIGVPAGTTTTYPVSTNPNAYQEGDDAKAAGYTLGDVVNGTYFLGNANVGYVMSYKTATSLSVSDNGVLSMPTDATSFNVTYSKNGLTTDQIKSYFAGKFVQLVAVGSDSVFSPSSLFKTAPSEILFIPSNSVVTKDEFKNFNIDRYQPVTGYAAIPAGTTIEYLGKLGDKARVQVVSYVGTGTNSSETPNSLVFDFAPKIVFILGWINTNSNFCQGILSPLLDYGFCMTSGYSGYGDSAYLTVKSSGNKITWTGKDPYYQLNESGAKYYAVAIG